MRSVCRAPLCSLRSVVRCPGTAEIREIDARRGLRAPVIRGHDSLPDCRSVPRLLRSPSPLFAKNKQKKKHPLFCKYFSLVEMRGIEGPLSVRKLIALGLL